MTGTDDLQAAVVARVPEAPAGPVGKDPVAGRISIVVPSFNQGRFLGQTLSSLIEQGDPDLEILVVDGGSKDESTQVIRRFEGKIAWWVSEPDRGQSHALNKGFERASGEWLGWLNSDDYLLPGALAAVRCAIAKAPERHWWIGGGHFVDESGRWMRDYPPVPEIHSASLLSDWRTVWFAQPSSFFSAALYRDAGARIREDLHYAMDLDLWLRMLARAKPGTVPKPLSAYRHHAGGKTEAIAVRGEAEIVQVLAEHLGIQLALDRVRLIAHERGVFERDKRRYERWLSPLFRLRAALRSRIWRS